jgi:serine protease AprX
MKRTIVLSTILVALSIFSLVTAINVHPVRAGPYIDRLLTTNASNSPPSAKAEVIIVLDHIPTSNDANAIMQFSRIDAPMTQLPMILAVSNYGNLTNIAKYPGVVSLWANRQLTYLGQVQTVTHSYGQVPVQHSWWNDIMHVPDVWNLGFQGQGIGVALIDTGVDATNPSLGYRFSNGLSQAPYRLVQNVKVFSIGEIVSNHPLGPDQIYLENQLDTDTTSGHGTSTAGLVAGTGDASNGIYKGAAPQANIIAMGAGDVDFVFHIVTSFDYLIAHKQQYNIRIVSNSWGSDFECSVGGTGVMPDPQACRNDPITAATKAAHDAGIAVFFAAGNSGPGHPTINPYAEPAWVVGVGAGTESKGLTDFSSRGCTDTTDPGCTNVQEQQPDLVAPGMNVISTKCKACATDNSLSAPSDTGNIPLADQPYYTTFGGTSAASPMAAGVGALILSANPTLTPDQLKADMKATTDPMLGYLSFQVGTGYVNALSAVRAAQGQGFKPTVTRIQAFGDQRYIYTQFIGGAVAVTDNWQDGSVPVFNGAKNISITVSWTTPAQPLQWEVFVFAPNDQQVALLFPGTDIGSQGATSVSTTVTNSTFIASVNNPGQTSGTWTVQVVNFNNPQTSTITVDVNYPGKAKTQMQNAHDIQSKDSSTSGLPANEYAVTQLNDGTVLSTILLAPAGAKTITADITQPANTVISVVQIVLVDNSGNIVEVRAAWVTTQTDLNARAAQIQQLLVTTADPTQVTTLQTELNAIQAAMPTTPITENLPALP